MKMPYSLDQIPCDILSDDSRLSYFLEVLNGGMCRAPSMYCHSCAVRPSCGNTGPERRARHKENIRNWIKETFSEAVLWNL